MKTNVFFKCVLGVSTFLSLTLAQGVNEYGMLPCPDGTNNCPPAGYGAPRGDLIRTKDSTNNVVYYQTNLSFSPEVGSYSSFTGNPLDNNGFSSLVYGDYSITGNTIMNFNKKTDLDNSSSYMLTELNNKYLNSSMASLYLPDSIEPKYIKYATLTWIGSIHKNNLTGKINKQSLVYSCAVEDNIVVRKQDKARIDHQDLIEVCLNSQFKNNVSCDEIPYKIKDGIYYPNPTNNSNYFNLNNYYKNIRYNPNANVNSNFKFACLEPGRQKMRKVDLKLIDDDVIKNCKEKYNNNKKCNDIFKVSNSGYYTPISYNNQKNSKLDFKCTAESYTSIQKKNLDKAYYNPKMVQECKRQFPDQASQCDNIISTKYYTPTLSYSIDRAEIGDGRARMKTILKSQIYYTVEELRKICVESGNSKEDCDGIDENFNGGIETFYKLVDEKECRGNKNSIYDKCYADNQRGKFGDLDINKPVMKIHSIKITLGDSHCTNNPKDCEEVKTCRNYTFSGGNINIDDYCSKNPESCSEVNTCKRYTYGSQPINLNDFCRKNKGECEEVKVCKQYNLHAISSTITPSKGDNRNLASISEKYIKDYNKMNFIAGGLEKEVFAKDEDIDYIFSYNNAQNQGGLWFVYSARADVTDFLKQALANTDKKSLKKEGNILLFPIAGANVKATDGTVLNSGGAYGDGVSFWSNGSFIYGSAKTANFGSWALTVVYDRGSMPSKSSPHYDFYKPKVVTIHNGFATLVHDLQKENDSKFLNMVFDDFYTPRQDKYDAKVSVYAVSNANYSIRFGDDEAAPFKISKYGDFSNMVNVYNILNNRHSYSGGISMVKPGAHGVEKIDSDLYKSISINTSMLNSTDKQIYMKKEQTKLKFNYGVKSRRVGSTTYAEQTYPSVFAFSTDLYVPDVCYYNTVYNSAGKSSRGAGFVVREGETVKNQVYFTIADNSEAEDASGLKVKAKLSDNIIYSNDSMRIDNSLTETGPNDFIDSKLKYMKDNQKGLYEDEEHTNLIQAYKDKQFNKYDGNYLSFFIGDGAGNVNGNNISGGSLNKNKKDKVYVEYKTRVGGYYEEPSFTYDFSLKGVELNYNISMAKCPSPSGKTEWENIVEVVPLDGVKVVNEDFKKKGDYEGLYTQVANEPFDLKINYDVNITGKSDDYLSKLLSDKKICILLGYTEQQCSDEGFMKGKVGEFNKKRDELNEEIQKLASEINKVNENIAKKQSELNTVLKELEITNTQIGDLTKRIADLKVAIEQKPDDNNLKKELANLESAKEKAEANKANLETKKKNLETEIGDLKGKLKTTQDNKDNKQSELGKLESGISGEMTRRVGRLDGKFETTLVTLTELGDRQNNCKIAKENKDIHFNHYQDFAIKEKSFKNEATKMDTIMYINKNKGNCADLKKGCFYKSTVKNAFPSFEYFTNDSDEDKIIDMKNIVVGFARPDYTFIVSYLPSGAEILTSCKQECISRYHDEPAATKDSKIEACQNVCIDKHNERIKQGKGEIDEKYLKEYRLDICAGDTFAVRPAYFKLNKELNKDETYNLGGNKLHESFKDNIYPSDKGGNYVLGYDSLLVPDDSNITANSDPNFTKSAILSTIVPDSCNLDEVKDIVRNADGKSISYSGDNKPTGSNTLWDNTVNASNNLRVDFRSFDKDGKDKNATERAFYNETTKANNISEFQKASNDKKKYANIDLGALGKLNYYNIGYAKMRLTDSSWTKYDKPYLDKEVKSYSYNKDKDSNKVGAYIGFKDQELSSIKSIGDSVKNKYLIPEDLVLKFTHDKVMVSVLGIKDKIIKQDPLKTDKIYTYTFFNTKPDDMGASLDLNVTAASSRASVCVDKECLKDKGNYNILEIYPTLYHKGCYARDIEFGLDFAFDCNKTAGDERCKSLEINPVGGYCDTHNLSSECYKPEATTNKFGKLKHGLVYSSSIKDGNISINSEVKAEEKDGNNEKKTVTKPGEVAVTVNKEGFDNAKFELPLKFNFKRFPGKNDRIDPKLIYADDFIRSNNVAFEEKDLPTDKKISTSEVLTRGIKAKGRIFKKFNNEILEISDSENKRYNGNVKDEDGNFLTLENGKFVDINQTSKATFYYGYINSEQKEYEYDESESVNGVNVDVYSMIYYTGNVDAAKATEFAKNNLPIIDDNIAAKEVNSNERSRFFLNRFEYYNSLAGITSNDFVPLNGYVNDNVEGLTGRRQMQDINNMYERLTLSVVQPDNKDEIVEVHVKPWFIYSGEDINYSDNFNIFKIIVESRNIANWGGTGTVKDGDIVGRYLYNEGNASKDRIRNLNTLDNAISW